MKEALEFAGSDPRLMRAGNNLVTTREAFAEEIELLEGKTSMMQEGAKGVAALSGTDVLVSGPIVLGRWRS